MKATIHTNNQRAQKRAESGIFVTLIIAAMATIIDTIPTTSTAWLISHGTIMLTLNNDDDPKDFWTSLDSSIASGEIAKNIECSVHGDGDNMKTAAIKTGTETGTPATNCTHKQGGNCYTFINHRDLAHINA